MSYSPDDNAIPFGTAFTRQLSQRDLSLQVPINYVTVPGVVLTSACFANQRYEEASAVRCISNLLAVGFQRFEVDIYWDASRQLWSLCPVQLGAVTSRRSAPRGTLDRPGDVREGPVNVFARQDASARSLTLTSTATQVSTQTEPPPSTTVTISSTAGSASPTAAAGSGTAIDLGDYSCTASTNLELLLKVVSSHLDSTQTNVNSTVSYLIFNLHEAARADGELPDISDSLPHGNNSLGTILLGPTTNISEYLYSPGGLADQRADLNASFSWFGVNPSRETESSYFDVDKSTSDYFTPNGWPGESFVEFTQAKRLLVGIGSIDSELEGYNLEANSSTVFSPGYLSEPVSVEFDSDEVESGCFFDDDVTAVSRGNNSWATVALNSSTVSGLASNLDIVTDLTRCGISPILNRTLGGSTADENFQPYGAFVQSTIWSWAEGQPRNNTDHDADDPDSSNRCAVLNGESGHWEVENCENRHYSACLTSGQPYRWSISDSDTNYVEAGMTCEDGTTFDTPRTALENRYLLDAWRERIDNNDLDDNSLLWINFNDLDAKACWVVGQNASCPYLQQDDNGRFVVVPVVASIIVFVLATLTVFVKCAANRQRARRRRKGDDGWDYEGVPS
ncbi:Maintenance of telomere capping protein 6 [Saxophila tyrrhenica]|uniref:Maintenance of telomere capping protein 6 n=1 Tax=Saxophila tyrrhenica TaxID=1690608 RepID=A0AAV9PNJ1_9PEZI|nr:Maintenance of telomere capping protein 6 [Saxophila tyrrhenica]